MNSGTLTKLVLNGVSYDVTADCDVTMNLSEFEKEASATTGKTLVKRTRRTQTMESVTITASEDEANRLKNLADGLADITMAITTASGATYRSTGQINFENYTTADAKATITLIPAKSRNAWALFKA